MVAKDNSKFKEIIKKYGDVVSTADRIFQNELELKKLSISPSLDLALGGGLLEGSVTMLSGLPGTGKTTVSLQIAANAQKEGRRVAYIDGEARLKACNLGGVSDLKLGDMDIIHSPPNGSPLSAEDFLNIFEYIIKQPEYKGGVGIIDSTSSLIPRAEMDTDVSGAIRATLPKMLAHWFRKNAQIIKTQKLIIIAITHFVTNTSGYGKMRLADSGLYLQYACSTRLEVKNTEDWMEGDKKIGLRINWDILRSAMGSHNSSCVSYLRFGKGLDKLNELIEIGVSLGIIDKSGSWFTASFMSEYDKSYDEKKYKFQGMANLYNFLSQNGNVSKFLEQKIRELLS